MLERLNTSRRPAVVALLLITAAAYLPAIGNGYIWDDDYYVTNNAALRDADGLRRIWVAPGAVPQYYPLTHTTFWIEYQLWELDPRGYHAVNVALHGLNAVLWWVLLLRLLQGRWAAALNHKRPPKVEAPPEVEAPRETWALSWAGVAWAAAAVFALHPVQVESVAWITERKNVLSGFFYLLAANAYFIWRDAAEHDGSERSRRSYVAALLLFVAALLSKTTAATLPPALLLVSWWRYGRLRRLDAGAVLPFFLVGAPLGLLTLHMETSHVGATGPEWDFSPADRVLIAGRALWFYMGKLLWPVNLTFTYPRWEIDDGVAWQYLFPLGFLALLALLWALRRRIGRGPLAAMLFFAGTLVPALGFFNVFPMRYSFVADHFQYMACMGAIVLATAAAAYALPSRAASLSVIGVLILLGILTAQQTRMYRDLETLWRETIRRNPDSWMAHNNLGTVLDDRGDHAEAVEHYRSAIALKPDHADAMRNLGDALMRLGRHEEAETEFRRSMRLGPGQAMTHAALGHLLLEQGRYDEAERELREALRLDGGHAASWHNLGVALLRQDRAGDALSALGRAVALQPTDAASHHALGKALELTERLEEAEAAYRRSVTLDSTYTQGHYELGLLLARQDRLDEAAAELRRALAHDPRHAPSMAALAVIRLRQGDTAGAIVVLREALQQEPDRISALRSLAWLLATASEDNLRDGAEAVRLAERAAELTGPGDPLVLDILAAAYAEAGDFVRAVSTAERAAELARNAGRDTLADDIAARRELYTRHQPYRPREKP